MSVNVVDVPSEFLPRHLSHTNRMINRQSQLAFSQVYMNFEMSFIEFLKGDSSCT
jgi:hypothetical protein